MKFAILALALSVAAVSSVSTAEARTRRAQACAAPSYVMHACTMPRWALDALGSTGLTGGGGE